VVSISPVDKTSYVISLSAGDDIVANAVIICTSFSHPLTKAAVGATWEERKAEMETYRKSVAAADTVMVVGGGTVGCEVAGTFRSMIKPGAKVVHVVSGDLLLSDKFSQREREMLTNKVRTFPEVELVTGDRLEGHAVASATKATYKLKSGREIVADVMIPSFAKFQTDFLPPELKTKGGAVKVDSCLMSTEWKNVFAVGCSDVNEHCAIPKILSQASTVGKNVALVSDNKTASVKHKTGAPFLKAEYAVFYGDWGMVLNDEIGCLGTLCFACGFPFPCFLAPCTPWCGVCGLNCTRPAGKNVPAFFEAMFSKGPFGPVVSKADKKAPFSSSMER
jgi:pyruvate/2-oxoglutarate dehydrogenase complex dihydrolipoamide dehydrogenase (E3) component